MGTRFGVVDVRTAVLAAALSVGLLSGWPYPQAYGYWYMPPRVDGNQVVVMSPGMELGQLKLHDNATLHMTGGTLLGGIYTHDYAKAIISGGEVCGSVGTSGNSEIQLTGGTFSGIYAEGDSEVEITGGTINVGIYAHHRSHVTIAGGVFNFLYGGIEWSHTGGSSRIDFLDGSCMRDVVLDLGMELHMRGGSIAGGLYSEAPVHFYGRNLVIDADSVSGHWASGESFDIRYGEGWGHGGGQIFLHEVPEPGTLALAALGGGVLLLCVRRRRTDVP